MEAETSGILSPQPKLTRLSIPILLDGVSYVLCNLQSLPARKYCSADNILDSAQIVVCSDPASSLFGLHPASSTPTGGFVRDEAYQAPCK